MYLAQPGHFRAGGLRGTRNCSPPRSGVRLREALRERPPRAAAAVQACGPAGHPLRDPHHEDHPKQKVTFW